MSKSKKVTSAPPKASLVDASGNPLSPIRFEKFSDIEPVRHSSYLVKGIVPRTGLVVVWGPPKCGKSFWILDLVVHVAAGHTYRGRRVQQWPVAYFAFEGHAGFRTRIAALKASREWGEIPLYLCGDQLTLSTNAEVLIRGIDATIPTNPGIVVLDTVNRSLDGSENDPEDMGRYIRAAGSICAHFDCAVILVHHCGIDTKRPRGHTSLTGAADAQISIKKTANFEILSTVEFMKDGPEGASTRSRLEPVSLGTDDDGDEIASCILHDLGQPDELALQSKPRLSNSATRIFQILKEILAAAELTQNGPPPSVLEGDWKTACISEWVSKERSREAARKAFTRAVDELTKSGLINRSEGKVWLS